MARSTLEALPAWFGIPAVREGYVEAAARERTFVPYVDGKPVGFLSLRRHTPAAWEIAVMAVLPSHQRRGVGRSLIAVAAAYACARGARYLTVKTLAPAARDANYARTRAFYRAMGFDPVELFPTLWGPDNPCLLLVKDLRRQGLAAQAAFIRSQQKPHKTRAEDLVREDRER